MKTKIKILVFIFIALILVISDLKNELNSLFNIETSLFIVLSYLTLILTNIIRARQILSFSTFMRAKIFGIKKIEDKICKNEEIDKIQNIFIHFLNAAREILL